MHNLLCIIHFYHMAAEMHNHSMHMAYTRVTPHLAYVYT